MGYFNVSENGAGRILFAQLDELNDFNGLAMIGLSTCTGIVIIGDQGISVVHDEGFLSIESIQAEFLAIGVLQEWAIFYNPTFLHDEGLSKRYQAMKPLVDLYKQQYTKDPKQNSVNEILFLPTSTGQLFIKKDVRSIAGVQIDLLNPVFEYPESSDLRKSIRMINNLCAYVSNKQGVVPVDIQFDGSEKKPPTPITLWNRLEVKNMISQYWRRVGDQKRFEEYMAYFRASFSCFASSKKKVPSVQ